MLHISTRSSAKPRQLFQYLTSTATKRSTIRRFYHDDDVYGYRVAREYKLPDYTPEELENRRKYATLLRMVQAYRTHGHEGAQLDPLNIMKRKEVLALKPERYVKGGLENNKEVKYNLSGILHVNDAVQEKHVIGQDEASFETILNHLQSVYCGKIAYEFMHLPSASERRWWYHAVESWEKPPLSVEQKKNIHKILSKSEVFDQFLGKKFPNVKRYGLEGAESMMVALDRLFELSARQNVRDIVVGMPHRGRLNLLCDLLQYPHAALFHKMKGHPEVPGGTFASGDVISHLANNPDLTYANGKKVHVSLLPNPSHLEAINPVAMGKARAKQTDLLASSDSSCNLGDRVMCVQIHGDAAFTGQGVVMETLSLSNLPHYSSGGSIHIVVNNQLGYTTPAQNARSSAYCSDIGKMINIPVVHVNGDYPEDVARAIDLVFEYRNKFRKDIILDLMCYRRWGHNELDEPAFTQPLMYNNIRHRTSVPKLYEKKLLEEKTLSSDAEAQHIRDQHIQLLEKGLEEAETYTPSTQMHLDGYWKNIKHITSAAEQEQPDTGYDIDILKQISELSVRPPYTDFKVHPRLKKYHIDQRLQKSVKEDRGIIDWSNAEAIAFGSLMRDGHDVRISGQDVGRGTFSQRHAMLVCQDTEKTVIPLNHMQPNQRNFLEVANSPLSEFAVLGFEYGMSMETPKRLVLWEAQFGDFFNGAQIIIDTFLSSGEEKWLRQSGLVMLLPHGQDGAGPEHSSSRIERFLQVRECDTYNCLENLHVYDPYILVVMMHIR
ncbi:oxoglutarate dehydrogenase, E1 component [Mycotypha africana]|uniref:oxoglutarate dehydrogenase, E1 component n=1 Tax=Mycotypha africana TaxID=64632 RepID=UPI00230129F4|nr:oxoglutarate dehydrogenase, E1 component [Mycotypha africana]KAI8991755.1 oxoglutarate dehydrogenase, E1 component [Mycotypha africana]